MAVKQNCVVCTRAPLPVTSVMFGVPEFPVLDWRILYLSTMIQIQGFELYESNLFGGPCYRNINRVQKVLSGLLIRIHSEPSKISTTPSTQKDIPKSFGMTYLFP